MMTNNVSEPSNMNEIKEAFSASEALHKVKKKMKKYRKKLKSHSQDSKKKRKKYKKKLFLLKEQVRQLEYQQQVYEMKLFYALKIYQFLLYLSMHDKNIPLDGMNHLRELFEPQKMQFIEERKKYNGKIHHGN